MDISQDHILNRIVRYLTLQNGSQSLIAKFSSGAYCHSLAVLAVYGLYLKSKENTANPKKETDDWHWFKSTLMMLDTWDGITPLSFRRKHHIDRLISLLEFFQHVSEYYPSGQGNLESYVETTKRELIKLEYCFGGLFSAADFTKRINLAIEGENHLTSLIQVLLQHQRKLIFISKGKHTLGLFRNGHYVSLYNANHEHGRVKFHLKDTRLLIRAIFKIYQYDKHQPSAFGFRIFTFDDTPAHYPDPASLLASIHQGNVAVHNVENMRYSALHIAARIGSTACIQYYLEQEANVNCTTPRGTTPICIAAERGRADVVKQLLEHGASTHIHSAFKRAAKHGYIDVLTTLFQHHHQDALKHLNSTLQRLPTDELRNELVDRLCNLEMPHLDHTEISRLGLSLR